MDKQIKLNKGFLAANIVMGFITLLLAINLIAWNYVTPQADKTPIVYKAIASVSFALTAIMNLVFVFIKKNKKIIPPILITSALLLSMTADIVLEFSFIAGGAIFAASHILFICAFSFILKFHWLDFVCGIVPAVIVVLLICFNPIFEFDDTIMEVFGCLYALLICLMGGKAISNFIRERNKINLVIFIGSILFMVSDFMLLFDHFGQIGLYPIDTHHIHCHIFYYPAQITLALSIYIYALFNKVPNKAR